MDASRPLIAAGRGPARLFEPRPLLRGALGILSWLVPLAFLAWAARVAVLEGYLYELPNNFLNSDFTRTAALGSPTWWTGQGIFYGPVFVLEYRYLLGPGVLSNGDFARLDFFLFGVAFACAWLALFGARRPRLAIFVLAAWLGHHASVEVFSTTAHLEVLELVCICAALLLAVRGRPLAGGSLLGLAIATKTLPGLFLPYLLLARRWRLLSAAIVLAGALFLVVCWIQAISPWDGLIALVYQGGNLTKLEFTEYEYSPRADIARILAGSSSVLTPEQGRIAIVGHIIVALITVVATSLVVARAPIRRHTYGLLFGLVGAVMLVVSPSAHVQYYVFLLPGWTAMLAALLVRPRSRLTVALWLGLVAGYVFTGFDQPFFLAQRLFGVGLVVPQHWLPWHLPTLALFLTVTALSTTLLTAARPHPQPRAQPPSWWSGPDSNWGPLHFQ